MEVTLESRARERSFGKVVNVNDGDEELALFLEMVLPAVQGTFNVFQAASSSSSPQYNACRSSLRSLTL
ncbi:hypothetical protein ACFX15_027564 [Malus domestica]